MSPLTANAMCVLKGWNGPGLYVETDLDNLYSWHINNSVGGGDKVRKISFLPLNEMAW